MMLSNRILSLHVLGIGDVEVRDLLLLLQMRDPPPSPKRRKASDPFPMPEASKTFILYFFYFLLLKTGFYIWMRTNVNLPCFTISKRVLYLYCEIHSLFKGQSHKSGRGIGHQPELNGRFT